MPSGTPDNKLCEGKGVDPAAAHEYREIQAKTHEHIKAVSEVFQSFIRDIEQRISLAWLKVLEWQVECREVHKNMATCWLKAVSNTSLGTPWTPMIGANSPAGLNSSPRVSVYVWN